MTLHYVLGAGPPQSSFPIRPRARVGELPMPNLSVHRHLVLRSHAALSPFPSSSRMAFITAPLAIFVSGSAAAGWAALRPLFQSTLVIAAHPYLFHSPLASKQ